MKTRSGRLCWEKPENKHAKRESTTANLSFIIFNNGRMNLAAPAGSPTKNWRHRTHFVFPACIGSMNLESVLLLLVILVLLLLVILVLLLLVILLLLSALRLRVGLRVRACLQN